MRSLSWSHRFKYRFHGEPACLASDLAFSASWLRLTGWFFTLRAACQAVSISLRKPDRLLCPHANFEKNRIIRSGILFSSKSPGKYIHTLRFLARARPTVVPTRHTDAAIFPYGYRRKGALCFYLFVFDARTQLFNNLLSPPSVWLVFDNIEVYCFCFTLSLLDWKDGRNFWVILLFLVIVL